MIFLAIWAIYGRSTSVFVYLGGPKKGVYFVAHQITEQMAQLLLVPVYHPWTLLPYAAIETESLFDNLT